MLVVGIIDKDKSWVGSQCQFQVSIFIVEIVGRINNYQISVGGQFVQRSQVNSKQLTVRISPCFEQLSGNFAGLPKRLIVVTDILAEHVYAKIFRVRGGIQISICARPGASPQLDDLARRDGPGYGVKTAVLVEKSLFLLQVIFLIILSEDAVERVRFPFAGL